MSLLYAIGVGAFVNVALAVVVRVARLDPRFDLSGASLVIAVAAAIVVGSAGLRPSAKPLGRLALLGLGAHAAFVLNRILGVAFTGRAPDDPVSTDAFIQTPRALFVLAVALALGTAAGLLARGFGLRVAWRPPERLARAAGVWFAAIVVAGLLWPGPFLSHAFANADTLRAAISLPLVVAAPLVAGAYASRAGLSYRDITLLGAFLALPALLGLITGTFVEIGRMGDPQFASIAAQIRVTLVLSWFLVILRVAAWPLGAAFAEGFLTPAVSTRSEPAP